MGQTTLNIQNLVEVEKSATQSGDTTTITYHIHTDHPRAEVRLEEQVPSSIDRSAIAYTGEIGDSPWRSLDGWRHVYECCLHADESVETELEIQETGLNPLEWPTKVTVAGLEGSQNDCDANSNGTPQLLGDGSGKGESISAEYSGEPGEQELPDVALSREASDTPAVAIVADGNNSDAVLRTTVRAQDRGYPVLVAICGDDVGEDIEYAERFGATFLELEAEQLGRKRLELAFTAIAKDRSYPGVILQTGTDRIDFERSERAFWSERRSISEAVPAAQEPAVIAGVPAFNEAATIGSVIRQARKHVDEILVVDDGSSDSTADRASDAGATVVEHEKNRGYGSALKTLFEEANARNAEHLVVLDGDSQHDPDDIPRLIEEQQSTGAEIVIGNRFGNGSSTNMPLYRRVGLRVINGMVNVSMGKFGRDRIGDAQSGFRAYDTRAIATIAGNSETVGDRMNASTDILYCAEENDFDIAEVGTTIDYDVSNPSTHSPVPQGMNVVNHILKTLEQNRPITVLGIPGFFFALAGIGLGYWSLSNFLSTGTFPFGTAILSSILVLTGVLAAFTSIILHSLNTHLDETI